MLYAFLKIVARIFLRGYFRKIEVDIPVEIDWSIPSILVSNHPDGFTEPLIMATHLPVDFHFLTRMDMFKGLLKYILIYTHQIPIARQKDGMSSLRENIRSFNQCLDLFERGGHLIVFGEGSTLPGKQIRTIQRGVDRLVSMAHKRAGLTVQLIPVTLTYSRTAQALGRVTLRLGSPISSDRFRGDVSVAAQIEIAMRNLGIHTEEIDRPYQYYGADRLIMLAPSDYARSESQWTHAIHQCDGALTERLGQIRRVCAQHGIDPMYVASDGKPDPSFILGLPVYLVCALLHMPIIGLAHYLAVRWVWEEEFFNAVRLAISLSLYILIGSLSSILVWRIWGLCGILFLCLILYLSAHIARYGYLSYQGWRHTRKLELLSTAERQEFFEIDQSILSMSR